MRFNYQLIGNILGLLIALNGAFMFLCLPFSLYYQENSGYSIALTGLITVVSGAALWFFTRKNADKELHNKDGYIIVTFGWIFMSLSGSLLYILTDSIPYFTDAFFETISGYTTTGASILTDIESIDKGVLFWRSLTQWIGGMGIIVLAVAILPILGIGGMQLFVAEAPGITPDKLKPRIKETAKRLWFIYLGLTLTETLFLSIGGMSFFEALNHSLTTMATGGFSTKNDSAASFSPFIQYVMIIFMFLAGTNFTLTYFGLKGDLKKVWASEEFRYYVLITALFALVSSVTIYALGGTSMEKSFRDALFQVVSVITTTGYVTADYTLWTPFITAFFFMMMFVGGSAGSTAGGVKVIRLVILFKNTVLEMKRQLHPSAVIPVRYNGKAVTMDITSTVLAFIILYITIFIVSTIVLAVAGVDFMTAMGAVATTLGNIGPGIGSVGPVNNFAHLGGFVKWFLSFLMLLGRLELFTVLMLFTRYFWKKY